MMKRITLIIFVHLLISLNLMGNNAKNKQMEVATFGGGCFWCVEAIFDRVKGVEKVVSGYSGGHISNPDYKMVTSGTSGHAEVIQITFDPELVSFIELLEIFFKTHDPTTLNRQGADIGTQYRSVILYHNQQQKEEAIRVIDQLGLEGIWNQPIITTVDPFEVFYSAEKYHQDYFENNRNQGYCRVVINPKLEKFEKVFSEKLK